MEIDMTILTVSPAIRRSRRASVEFFLGSARAIGGLLSTVTRVLEAWRAKRQLEGMDPSMFKDIGVSCRNSDWLARNGRNDR